MVKKRIAFSLLLVNLIFAFSLKAQTDFKMYTDTNHIRIGEQINVKLVVINHSDQSPEITWPFAMDTLSQSIEILELMPVDTQSYEEETIYSQQWHLTSFDTGYQVIPPFEIIINGKEIESDPFEILVETVAIDTTQAIKAIKGVEDVPISILEWVKYHWKWFAGFAVLAILIFGIYLIIKNKNKELILPEKPKEPEIPPYDFALQRLNKLKEGKWWQQGDVKYYHAGISEILREYLEHEFDFPALEQTTREVMRSIRLTSIEQSDQKHLHKILLLSDLVKYAKEKPLAEENEDMMKLALAFVKNSKQEEEMLSKEETSNEA